MSEPSLLTSMSNGESLSKARIPLAVFSRILLGVFLVESQSLTLLIYADTFCRRLLTGRKRNLSWFVVYRFYAEVNCAKGEK